MKDCKLNFFVFLWFFRNNEILIHLASNPIVIIVRQFEFSGYFGMLRFIQKQTESFKSFFIRILPICVTICELDYECKVISYNRDAYYEIASVICANATKPVKGQVVGHKMHRPVLCEAESYSISAIL